MFIFFAYDNSTLNKMKTSHFLIVDLEYDADKEKKYERSDKASQLAALEEKQLLALKKGSYKPCMM